MVFAEPTVRDHIPDASTAPIVPPVPAVMVNAVVGLANQYLVLPGAAVVVQQALVETVPVVGQHAISQQVMVPRPDGLVVGAGLVLEGSSKVASLHVAKSSKKRVGSLSE
jgi:hypothetical protein